MREALHQLTLALALPITVAAVWIVRGDPGSVRPLVTAAAYRAQLAELPLPQSPKLRAPREASEWRRAPQESELPFPPRRRAAALPTPAASQPLALSASEASARAPEPQVSAQPAAPEPTLAPDPRLRAPRALSSLLATLPIVASAAAPADDDGARAVEPSSEPKPAPAVVVAASASEAKPAAQLSTPSARAVDAPPIVKPAAAVSPPVAVPSRPVAALPSKPAPSPSVAVAAISVKSAPNPSVAVATTPVKPAPSAPVVAAAPALREKPATAAARVTPAPSVRAPQRDRASEVVLGVRDVAEKAAKTGREEIAAAALSPAVAEVLRGVDEALDLLLGTHTREHSLVDSVLPALPAASTPRELAGGSSPFPAPLAPAAEATPGLLGLPRQALAALAAHFGADEVADEPADFASEHRSPPVFSVHAIPEPGSALSIGAGLAAIAMLRRRVRRR